MAQAPVNRWEAIGLTLVWGSVTGVTLAVSDVAYHGASLGGTDTLVGLALITLPTLLVFFVVMNLIRMGLRLGSLPTGRESVIRSLAVVVWLALTGGFALFVTD